MGRSFLDIDAEYEMIDTLLEDVDGVMEIGGGVSEGGDALESEVGAPNEGDGARERADV